MREICQDQSMCVLQPNIPYSFPKNFIKRGRVLFLYQNIYVKRNKI